MYKRQDEEENGRVLSDTSGKKYQKGYSYSGSYEDEQELQAIFERTFGPVKRERAMYASKTTVSSQKETVRYRPGKPRKEEYLLVDGYNIVFARCV